MQVLRLLWFIFWRMSLWGTGLGLGLGAAYGTLVGVHFYPFGLIFGPLLGAMYGTIAGLPLGLLEGMVLGAVTMTRHRRAAPDNSLQYRRAAGLACSAVCVVSLAVFFELTARLSGTTFVGGPAYYGEDVVFVSIFLVAPSILASAASWWAGAKVAKRYMDGFDDPKTSGFTQATGKEWARKCGEKMTMFESRGSPLGR